MSHQGTNSWRRRDYLAAALLFLGTAGFIVWQNTRVAVLWDLGYLLDTGWRIALGQMPYRDFPLAHAPLTFLIQAGLIRLGGRHFLLVAAYAAIAGGLASVLTWRILVRMIEGAAVFGRATWLMALVIAAPLIPLGIYSIYPHPIYDCDCTLAMLVAILMLVRIGSPREAGAEAPINRGAFSARLKSRPVTNQLAAVAGGVATVVPLFFKQNMGLPFLGVVVAGMFVLLSAEWMRTRWWAAVIRSHPALVLAGMMFALLAALGIIAATAGLGNYIHWTVQFAAQRRLPGLASMIGVYQQPSFAWTLPTLAAGLVLCHTRFVARWWGRIAAFCLIAAPFAGSLIFLLIDDDADERADNLLALWPLLLLAALVIALFELRRGITLGRLIPFFILAAIHGTFLAQQLWGSTYALWPLLMVLVAFLAATLPAEARPVAVGGAAIIAVAFLVCGGLYAASLERLSYVKIPDGPVERSSVPALRGMATPGPFLSNVNELVSFTQSEIPPQDGVLPLPGEDPFYYATGRTPGFPVTMFDPATDPYSAAGLMDEARRRNVRWVMVKRALQINENPMPEFEETMRLVQRDFGLYRRLRGYDVYRRR